MPISVAERKHRMPYGMQKEIADRLGVSEAYVSLVMAGEVRPKTKRTKLKLRRVQVEIARALKVSVDEAFTAEELGYAIAA